MQTRCSTCSVILNAIATQYTCSLGGVYHPHRLVQRSHHCSCMRIPVHAPWLPGYISVTQTILIIQTMAELFQDRSHILVLLNMKDLKGWVEAAKEFHHCWLLFSQSRNRLWHLSRVSGRCLVTLEQPHQNTELEPISRKGKDCQALLRMQLRKMLWP